MSKSIVLAFDVAADPARVYQILTTTQGQSAFWTADCDVHAGHARFGFPGKATVEADITTQPERLVRMNPTPGLTHGGNVTWEYELHPVKDGTTILFRDYGFPQEHSDMDLGRTARTWAQIMDRLISYIATGKPQPFFPATADAGRIEQEILIDAPPAEVWQLITDPGHIGRWFSDAADIDLRPGGTGTLTFTQRATNAPATTGIQVKSVTPPRLFSFRWDHPADAPAREGNSLLVEISLTAESDSTRVRVVESGFTSLERPEQQKAKCAEVHARGWDIHLASLQNYASGQSS